MAFMQSEKLKHEKTQGSKLVKRLGSKTTKEVENETKLKKDFKELSSPSLYFSVKTPSLGFSMEIQN